jgi:hypothetical protein
MRAAASKRRSSFGAECVRCGNYLIAPDQSQHRDGLQIVHFWSCPRCDCSFEVIVPADTKSIKDIMKRIEDAMRRIETAQLRLVA